MKNNFVFTYKMHTSKNHYNGYLKIHDFEGFKDKRTGC